MLSDLPRFRAQPGHYEITLIAPGHRRLEEEEVLGSGIVVPFRRRAPQASARPSARASRPSARRRPGRRPRPGHPGCVKPEMAKAPPQRTTTTTSHCRQRGYADALVSTSVHVNAHGRAVEVRAASSAPRGTAYAERDHKSGGAFSSARIAAQEAGWCIMMTFTELMHDLEASRTQRGLPLPNCKEVSWA